MSVGNTFWIESNIYPSKMVMSDGKWGCHLLEKTGHYQNCSKYQWCQLEKHFREI